MHNIRQQNNFLEMADPIQDFKLFPLALNTDLDELVHYGNILGPFKLDAEGIVCIHNQPKMMTEIPQIVNPRAFCGQIAQQHKVSWPNGARKAHFNTEGFICLLHNRVDSMLEALAC